MTTILRTEEWTKELGWGITTVVLEVLEGERVYVADQLVQEFRLDPASSKEVVPEGMQRFVNEFDYTTVSEGLTEDGWSYAGTT